MKRFIKTLPLLIAVSLTACSKETFIEGTLFLFDTTVTYRIKNVRSSASNSEREFIRIIKNIDAISDSYKKRDITSVYDLNQTNEKVQISDDLYDLLSWSNEAQKIAPYYNPLVGSLSKLWKEALTKNEVLSDTTIQEELEKINNSELVIEETEAGLFAQRIGEATIDLGAIAKGYAIDKCQEYLSSHSSGDYLINAGRSSILLGENSEEKANTFKGPNPYKGFYSVRVNELSNKPSFYVVNSVISTSGVSEQGVKIGDATYSHIVNPLTGSAISLYDTVIVVSYAGNYGNGALGDALSTSFMMSSLEEIKEAETNYGVKAIVIKDDTVIYKNADIELK